MELFEEDEKINDDECNQYYINEIRKMLNVMKKSKYRTTNFSLIEYFAENNFHPLNKKSLINKLLKEYNSNPQKFVLSKGNGKLFNSTSSFMRSILYHISKNNSFISEPDTNELSLDLENTYNYLLSVYNKYTSNSKDVKTPIRVNHSHYNFKKENNVDDSDNYDIEILPNKKRAFSKKEMSKYNNIRNHNINNNNEYLEKKIELQDNDKSSGYNTIITLSDSSISKESKEDNNEDNSNANKNIPQIFLEKLTEEDNLISLLSKDTISNLLKKTNDYITNIKKEKKEKILFKLKEKIKNICISLNHLIECKSSYDKIYKTVDNLQDKVFEIWKVMNTQLNVIITIINNNIYRYGLYKYLRDAIFKAEGIYNEYMKKIKNNLSELKDKEIKFKDEIENIQKVLLSIKSHLIYDNNLLELCLLIETELKSNHNEFQLFDDMCAERDINNDLEMFNKVDNVIKLFNDEKNKIKKNLVKIDQFIGNIIIY